MGFAPAARSILLCCGLLGVVLGCGAPDRGPDLENGRALYARYGCAACHGPSGAGDGPAAFGLAVPPRDFRQRESFVRGRSLEAISSTIAEGIPGSSGAMPPAPYIPAEERQALAAYVLSLAEPSSAGSPRRPEP